VTKTKTKRSYLIPILSKALDVLELLEKSAGTRSLEDVFKKTRIPRTSIFRILKTFEHRGYIAHTEPGRYQLGPRQRRLRFGIAVQSAEMPFSVAVTESIAQAAAAAGVELLLLDNCNDPDIAILNAEELVANRVDLAIEFQVNERVATRVANIFKKANVPLVAVDVPHPNATYFGVDNPDVGYDAGSLLAQYAKHKWNGKVDRVLGLGFSEAGTYVEARISSAFDGIRDRLPNLPADRFLRLEGRGMRQSSRLAVADFLRGQRKGQHILVAAATDSSALGVLDAVRHAGREGEFAIAGQECIPEVLEEMRNYNSAIIGSVSHEAHSYGPRLIQLGITLLRGYTVPPYNYVRHHVITPETLDAVHTDEQAAEPRELGREPVKITTQDRSTPTCRPSEPLLEVPGTPGPTVGQ
jgi:ribose transport system substrate-binding protein